MQHLKRCQSCRVALILANSNFGGIQFLGDKLVSWMSKKQDCTAMSSAEVKYVELYACVAQVMWDADTTSRFMASIQQKYRCALRFSSAIAISLHNPCSPLPYQAIPILDSQCINNIMAAGSKEASTPMLRTGRYSQWHSRFLRYLDTKSNGEYLRKCIFDMFQNEVNDIRSERLARSANPLALLAAAPPYSDNYYEAPKPQRSNAPSYKQSSSTRSSAKYQTKRLKDRQNSYYSISGPFSEEDSDPEKLSRVKDMQKNLAIPLLNITPRDLDNLCQGYAGSQSGVKDFAYTRQMMIDVPSKLKKQGVHFASRGLTCAISSYTDYAIGTGQLKEKTKVISDLKVKEGKDIDTMIEMEKQFAPDGEDTVTLEKEVDPKLDKTNLNSRTSNVNAVCAECGKCVFNSDHDACVSRYLKDVNARTKKPKVVPISASKPKRKANKSVATPHKKTVASDTTIQIVQLFLIHCLATILGYGGSDSRVMSRSNGVITSKGPQSTIYFSCWQFCDSVLEIHWNLFLRSKDLKYTRSSQRLSHVDIQRNLQAQVITVRTDRGTEFLNKTLHAYFKEEGIEHQTSTPRTPEQNGVVERRNRTLVEAARTMLSASKLPLSFWAEAVATACYTQNRSIIISTHGKTAYHIINDRKPSIKHLHIFGCTCYITRDGENLDKMKEKGGGSCCLGGIFTQFEGIYLVYNKRTRLIVESIHIKFDEIKEMMVHGSQQDRTSSVQTDYKSGNSRHITIGKDDY
ncbi:retrovirus-related pol polyprotein from transposon TNT 1-94 [Tanacetum coccineum]